MTKEDYFSQLDDYDEPFCEQQYTYGPCLFACSNPNPLISLIPRTTSNFRHLLSCGTIAITEGNSQTFARRATVRLSVLYFLTGLKVDPI